MISRSSRYVNSILYTDGPEEFLGGRRSLDTRPRSDDRFHTVVDGDRLDLLAYRYLGRAELWWVIADWNEIGWALDLERGVTLRIPALSTILLDLTI